jgi:hypothetical protein
MLNATAAGENMAKKYSILIIVAVLLLIPSLVEAQMDKAMHASAGFGITISVTAATGKPKVGLLAGIGAGIAKEAWDSTRRGHTASLNDFLATAVASGGAFALWKLALNRKPPVKIARAVDLPSPASSAENGGYATSTPAVPESASATIAPGGGQK